MSNSKSVQHAFKLSVLGARLEDSYEITFNFPKDPANHLVINRSLKESTVPTFQSFEMPLDEKERNKLTRLFFDAIAQFDLNEKKNVTMDGISVSIYIGGQYNSVNHKFYNLKSSADAGESVEKIMKMVTAKLSDAAMSA